MEEKMCRECSGGKVLIRQIFVLSGHISQELAGKDLFKLGIEVISFSLKDITDDEEYLTAISRLSIAVAARDAAIGVAEENRDIDIKTFECRKETSVVQFKSRQAIEEMVREANLKKARFHQETQRAFAIRDLAEDLEKCKQAREMALAEKTVELVVKRKQVQIEEREIVLSTARLLATVELPTEAEAYKMR